MAKSLWGQGKNMTLTPDWLSKRNLNVKIHARRRRRQLRPSCAIADSNRSHNTQNFFMLLQKNETNLIYSVNKAAR
jgi:hypothetical protein